jgi:hypothetical protein
MVVENGREVKVYEFIDKPDEIDKIVDDKELYTLTFEDGDVEKLVEEYSGLDEVEYVEPNYIFRSFVVPDDESYGLQGWMDSVGLEKAWNLTKGNRDVKIAVIDTGVDWDHPDLLASIWNNSDEGCDSEVDADGNGYFGDCRGYDFVDINVTTYENLGYVLDDNEDYNVSDNDPMDYDGHGTHVAGIANGVGDNGEGIAGTCWNCSLMAVRSGFRIQLPSGAGVGSLEVDDVVSAIYYAGMNDADIISMSFGGGDSVSVRNAINDVYESGSILLAASGNSGSESRQYPCAYDEVLCVAATDGNNNKASYSTYGDWVGVSAPGSGIYSTYFDDKYASLSGTSMATPVVAGSIGLIKSLFDKNQSEIESVLVSTGLDVDFNGVNIPQIDVYQAMLILDDIKPSVELVDVVDGFESFENNLSLKCNASDWQLSDVGLRIWNASELIVSEDKNVSGVFVKEVFNISLGYGEYYWNCLVEDKNGNRGMASDNYSLSVISKNVATISLESPINGSYVNVSLMDFNCLINNFSGYELVEFRLFNESGLVDSDNVSIDFNNSFSHEFSGEDNFKWSCVAIGDNDTLDLESERFDFFYDVTNPVVELLGPDHGSEFVEDVEINFNFSVSEMGNCSLIVDGDSVGSIVLNGEGSIVSSYDEGSYEWSFSCVDLADNLGVSESRSFDVVDSSNDDSGSDGSSGSSGGDGSDGSDVGSNDGSSGSSSESGSSSGSDSSSSSGSGSSVNNGLGSVVDDLNKNYIVSNELILEGYSKELKIGDEIQFTFLENGEFEYSLIVNEIGVGFVDVNVDGESFVLEVGDSAKLSLVNEEFYDLIVELININGDVVEVRIQRIDEKIVAGGITGFAVDEGEIEDGELYNFIGSLKDKKWLIVLGFLGVLVVGFVFKRRAVFKSKMHLAGHKEKFNKFVRPDPNKFRR